ncbi:MAG: PSD1 domain-containing protein [Planctomycetia bacterium]|nr:PSD1 domain-containing protein [Planctomycetia bacterium]
MLFVLPSLVVLAWSGGGRAEESLLERDVLPILTKQCLGCHGGLRQQGKLDLRTVPAMLKGGKSGPAVKSGDLDASEMWARIANDDMPPHEKKLSAAEKAAIKQWIAAGLPTVAQRQQDDAPLLPAGSKHEPRQVAAAIDQHLDRALAAAKLSPAPRADDAEFLRRVYIDLTGRVPTAEQTAAFLDDAQPDKRVRLIDALLASPQFGEQFGRTWRDWICPPELPSDGNGGAQPHKQAQDLGVWLAARFNVGDGWNKITREILTVEGEIKTRPQVIFYGLVGEGGKATPDGSTRAVASLFLGVQLQCAQCHDDPYRSWAQTDHWALAAFFGKMTADFTKVTEPATNKGGAQISIPKTAFKNVGVNVPAAFLGGKHVAPPQDRSLRSALADWLTARDNPYFARAFANRVWFYFFARGLVNPIDDFRELNPPSHPGLMALLANEFAAADFDVKHLIRCVCNSEAYQRTSRVASGTSESATATLTTLFGRMPLRIMTADMLYDSLKLAYGDPKLDLRSPDTKNSSALGQAALVADPYLEFLRRFGTNEEDATDFTHGIPQMLTMLNHPRLLAGSKALEAYRKARPAASPEQTVEWLYLSTLSRRPSADESADAQRYLQKTNDPVKGFNGVLWMLVNRSEYLFVR